MKKQLAQILLVLIVVFITSCNKDVKRNHEEIVEKPNKQNELTISLQFKSNKADNFKLSLNNIVVDEFQKKNIQIIEKIEPSSGFDEIYASFGTNNVSNNLIINFGDKNEKTITIDNILITLNSKSININHDNFNTYFSHNKFVKKAINNNITLSTIKKNGKLNPVIFAKPNLINSLME
jgi:outer membrane lipopolysaccharide assembly protein LptE/RlpB